MKSEAERQYLEEIFPTLTPEEKHRHYLLVLKFLVDAIKAKGEQDTNISA